MRWDEKLCIKQIQLFICHHTLIMLLGIHTQTHTHTRTHTRANMQQDVSLT
jgi:hypothetical protein